MKLVREKQCHFIQAIYDLHWLKVHRSYFSIVLIEEASTSLTKQNWIFQRIEITTLTQGHTWLEIAIPRKNPRELSLPDSIYIWGVCVCYLYTTLHFVAIKLDTHSIRRKGHLDNLLADCWCIGRNAKSPLWKQFQHQQHHHYKLEPTSLLNWPSSYYPGKKGRTLTLYSCIKLKTKPHEWHQQQFNTSSILRQKALQTSKKI